MQFTPSQAYEHIKESVIEYMETVYKIANKAVFQERSEILRQRGIIAQAPFIEATPAFPPAHKLIELEHTYPQWLPTGLSELVQHGVPVDRFPLYTHQEEALISAFGEQPNLLVATGTGSGKTESFLLPILADILREALTWEPIRGPVKRGHYDEQQGVWVHSRLHEARPAALRGIILYPMNALVNDQLSRLRRILARGTSPSWQHLNLNGNVIHFGMYTSLTQPTGGYHERWRRDRYASYLQQIEEDWQKLREDLRDTGSWPRPDSPEMLCRWDIQAAPPDILVTNYSMLEYMLVRPIEYPIFQRTRQWLESTPDARLTLVLDEAHTYTGAKGTEVAYLVRRLKERLGIEPGSPKFRAIATTASVPSGADQQLLAFTADLFGEPSNRFTLVRVGSATQKVPKRSPTLLGMQAFARFHDSFSAQEPIPAIEQLAQEMDLGLVDRTVDPQVALHDILEKNEDVLWVRQRTARHATLLDELANECWEGLGSPDERERATAGILAAGSFARPVASPDVPPLLSMRVHAFFQGLPGIWACMDPQCSAVPAHLDDSSHSRPIGKLYMQPRPWCDCGSRVLELFSCRHCGLLFLGGIPDTVQQSLWPWSDDLSGERQDLQQFAIFGVEQPYTEAQPEYRSTRTTLHTHPNDQWARRVYEIEPAQEAGRQISPFPTQCPRCQQYRVQGQNNGREVIEPLRTKGPRSFSVIAEDGFRVQPRSPHGSAPNYGRKALLFTDSRMEAAQLAADVRQDHHNDLFRQLVYRVLYSCPICAGSGETEQRSAYIIGQEQAVTRIRCPHCGGSGHVAIPSTLSYEELRDRVLTLQFNLGINPTNGEIADFFAKVAMGVSSYDGVAKQAFAIGLRRELSEDEFALEPLGLASWRIKLPSTSIGAFEPLNEEETRLFIRAIARILATENVLLPPQPHNPWDWPEELVREYERNVLIPGQRRLDRAIPYNLTPRRKLGRYVRAIAQSLVVSGRLQGQTGEEWINALHWPLWKALKGLNVLEWAGAKIGDQVPYGIRIDSFELHPIEATVQQCQACAYVMSEALFSVCLRCGQHTKTVPASTLHNFYRRAALNALPNSGFDDPYPLRAIEHSAQIPGHEARDYERWFQDLFHDAQHPLDHRIDVLSVTTTMEMGIDIGSLLSIGLRNVPPTVANYQQRAGRAGRRGSAIATVLTFAQFRSHDQYYFDRPPEIVSDPPRVPALYLHNEVIARRHVRSLVLQEFFYNQLQGQRTSGLFGSWGTVAEFNNRQMADRLQRYLATNRAPLMARCAKIVSPAFVGGLRAWVDELRAEVQRVVNHSNDRDDLLGQLINEGLLPKYAFPVDVVSLTIPSFAPDSRFEEFSDSDGMQRDLKIALAEYAPGAEVIRGSFPNTFIYRSAAVYDAFNRAPDYHPTGILVECEDCQSVAVFSVDEQIPDQCQECRGLNVTPLPYLRPRGFSVDHALQAAGREPYRGGGRDRAGYTLPARLLVGQTVFNTGDSQAPFAPDLYARVREGELFSCNKGPNRDFPGFLICPVCGRMLDSENPTTHRYPADVPPHRGLQRGPRAGQVCPNHSDFRNQVILGHKFYSEVILLGVDLPETMDAPYGEPSGKAIWYSFGTLVATAAALILQIESSELKVGARAVRRGPGRIHGEVFLYDDVPGGAGYARAIEQHLQEILEKALELGEHCFNSLCTGACYHCMYDYRNQFSHPLLDRELGTALLRYVLHGTQPTLHPLRREQCINSLAEFARTNWQIKPGVSVAGYSFPSVLQDRAGEQIGLGIIHPLQARPTPELKQVILAQSGLRTAVHTSFDLERRPFWVLNNLVR